MSPIDKTKWSSEAPPRILAVIVACDRPSELRRLLAAIAEQTVSVAGTIVIDNDANPKVEEIARRFGAEHHRSVRNLGGAGGFALGMLLAMAAGADLLWLWDDDGWPGGPDCLGRQLDYQARTDAAITSPLVVSESDPTRTSFGFRIAGRSTFDRGRLPREEALVGHVHLFNGALIPAAIVQRYGLPDLRLFIRGDEEDFLYRVLRGGGHVATVLDAIAFHPSGEREVVPLLGGRLFAVYPADPGRRRLMFRNKGYLFWRHHAYLRLALNIARYTLFFLFRWPPDVQGFREWLRCTVSGAREHLGPDRGGDW